MDLFICERIFLHLNPAGLVPVSESDIAIFMPRLRAIHISVYDLQVIDRRVARNAPDLANRLLPDGRMLMPHDRGSATATLVRYWPEYRKPISANRLVSGLVSFQVTVGTGLPMVVAGQNSRGEQSFSVFVDYAPRPDFFPMAGIGHWRERCGNPWRFRSQVR